MAPARAVRKALASQIGKRIKQAIEDFGRKHGYVDSRMPYEALSRIIFERSGNKLSVSRISNYANGIRMPGPREASLMAEALNCDAAWLMCIQNEITREESQLLRNYRALPERERKSYFQRIEVLSMAYREPTPDEAPPASQHPSPASPRTKNKKSS